LDDSCYNGSGRRFGAFHLKVIKHLRYIFFVNQEELITRLVRNGYLKSPRVVAAMKKIPREEFVLDACRQNAYDDTPLTIGFGQTISAPHMVAIMLEALDIRETHRVLEIGTGSGYHAALAAALAPHGHVYTVECIDELAETASCRFSALGLSNVTVTVDDGSRGLPAHAPYDRIYATCAAPRIPEPFIEQLTSGGRLLVPVGRRYGDLRLVTKNDRLSEKSLGGCAFVPMVGTGGY
jgi:protein-L-isoaspartate(D-aspartate) O-methyltransferase